MLMNGAPVRLYNSCSACKSCKIMRSLVLCCLTSILLLLLVLVLRYFWLPDWLQFQKLHDQFVADIERLNKLKDAELREHVH